MRIARTMLGAALMMGPTLASAQGTPPATQPPSPVQEQAVQGQTAVPAPQQPGPETPGPQTPAPQQPPPAGTAAPAPGAPAPAVPAPVVPPVALGARVFTAGSGLIFNAVRPDRVVDFEFVIGYLQAAMAKSTSTGVRAQAQGWRVFKATEPGPNGTALYVFLIDPAAPGADYGLGRILSDEYPDQIQEIWKLYTGALAGGGSLLNLTPVKPPPLPAPGAKPTLTPPLAPRPGPPTAPPTSPGVPAPTPPSAPPTAPPAATSPQPAPPAVPPAPPTAP